MLKLTNSQLLSVVRSAVEAGENFKPSGKKKSDTEREREQLVHDTAQAAVMEIAGRRL